MSKQLKLRRGTTAQHSTFTGASGEVTVDTTKKTLVVHDGTTAGGNPVLSAAAGAVGTTNLADAGVTPAKLSANAPTWSASGVALPRVDSTSEGGQLNFNRASDNTATWAIDSFGSTATPSLRFIDGANVRALIDGSGNVGIGTSSPSTYVNGYNNSIVVTNGSNSAVIQGRNDGPSGAGQGVSIGGSYSTNPINGARIWLGASGSGGQQGQILFFTKPTDDNTNQPTERARIDSSGNFFVNSTSFPVVGTEKFGVQGGSTIAAAFGNSSASNPTGFFANSTNGTVTLVRFSSGSSGTTTGNITANGTNTTYSTSSDYRLKENIAPMIGALSVVQQLKPCTYNWKLNGSEGQGFIAHELQAVVPDAVVGEKDAVDEDGNPIYQGIDTSFLVATLTAAIQEQQAIIEQLKADVEALKAGA